LAQGRKGERGTEKAFKYSLGIFTTLSSRIKSSERIWRLLRYEVTTNRYFPDIDAIETAVRKKQRQIKNDKIRSTCNVN